MKTQCKKISGIMLMLLLLFGLPGFAQVTITPNITAACNNNGQVTFSVSGATGPFTFEVEETAPDYNYYQQTSSTFTGLAAGTYQVYLYGNGGDSATTTFIVPAVVNASAVATNTTCPANNGTVVTTVTGGTTPYTYLWSNGATTSNLANLAGGDYNLTVTDANGCFAQLSETVVTTNAITVNINTTGPICSPVLTAMATGGTGNITYSWSTGALSASISGPSINNYTDYYVTATDANGCTGGSDTYVSVTNLDIDSSGADITSPTCPNVPGAITVVMDNGTAPFSYSWSNGSTTGTITGLQVGNYNVTVTDADGCSASTSYGLTYESNLGAYFSVDANPACGQSDGELAVYVYEISGVHSTYTYQWSNGGGNIDSIINLPAGNYGVTVTDASGCSTTVGATLTGIPAFSVSISTTPTACDTTLQTGTATAVVTGSGTPPYSFIWTEWNWQTNTNTVISNTQTVSNLGENTYLSVQVTDANGCTYTENGDSSTIQLDPSCYDHITGYVYVDSNGNCTFDNGEHGYSNAYVIATGSNGQTYYANPDSNGFYDIEVLPGIYTVTYYLYSGGSCTTASCVTSYTDTFTTIGQVSSGNNFGIGGGSAAFDLGVHMGYEGSAPGQQREYWVYYYNWGLTPVANGTLTFVHDPNITLVSTTPAYTSYDAATYTLTWDINNNLAPMQWLDQQHQVVMYFQIPASLSLGTELTAAATITPVTGDCNPSNNSEYLTDLVTASHDPNSKQVSPAGNLTASDTVLTYTIRFQNTGNAPANMIVISDTLSPNVNPASVQPGASSAPYTYKMSGNGVLTFTFQNINLADSLQSPDSSQGFVMYTVQVNKNLPLNAQINNTAYVYFDANPAVVTNTTSNLRSNFSTGIINLNTNPVTSKVIPNPASEQARIEFTGATGLIDLKITDALGNIIATNHKDDTYYVLNVERLAAGIYFYTAEDANGNKTSGKISVIH